MIINKTIRNGLLMIFINLVIIATSVSCSPKKDNINNANSENQNNNAVNYNEIKSETDSISKISKEDNVEEDTFFVSMDMENKEYEFFENLDIMVDRRIFRTEGIPGNIPEDIVVRDFLYTITAEFDKKYAILADIESHIISIENEKRLFEEGIFVQSYIIHKITTLTEGQYSNEKTTTGEINPLFYLGWKQRIAEFELIDYQIVNIVFTVVYSNGGIQWGDGTYDRSFIVGKKLEDIAYRIYDFGFM